MRLQLHARFNRLRHIDCRSNIWGEHESSRRAESLCLTVAEGDVAAFARLYPLNARPVQRDNRRYVLMLS
jgi:hypothetical protein